ATLQPALSALAYLHSHGLVHGRLKPANVMAAGDQLKLSSDHVCKAGEPFPDPGQRSPYDPPEKTSGVASPAADVWSLGMTLVEILTQRLPASNPEQSDPVLPEDLPAPFFDIVRGCLRRDPRWRWKISEVAACLRPAHPLPQERKPVSSQEKSTKRRLVVPAVVAVLAIVAIVAGRGLLRREPESRPNISITKPEQKPASEEAGRPAQQTSKSNETAPAALVKPSPVSPASVAPAATTRRTPAENDVVHKVLPDVPESAQETIQGTIRVIVRVQVDRSGNVVGSELDFPGPSKYFARLAMQAAQNWKFAASGQNDMRVFILRFEFTDSDTTALATRAGP